MNQQLTINNTLTGQQWVETLTQDAALIGRALDIHAAKYHASQQIQLLSRLVSGVHAHFVLNKSGDWWITNLSKTNRVLVGDVNVEATHQGVVKPGEEVRIGEFSLVLVEQGQAQEVDPNADIRSLFVELEREIHLKLLKWIEVRREDNFELESDQARERILNYLDEILNKLVEQQSIEFIRLSSKFAFSNRLSHMITSGNKVYGASHTAYSANQHEVASYDSALARLGKRFVTELHLKCENSSMEHDVGALNDGFHEIYQTLELDFSRAMQIHLVREQIRHDIFDLVFGLGPLQDLIEMECISEIMVVSREQIFVEKFGVVEDSRRSFFSDEMLLAVIERIVQPLGRRIDRSSPMVDARLADGSRVNAVIPPLAVKGPCVTIRKFKTTPYRMEDLISFNALSNRTARFLEACVMNKQNIIVSGGTGSGKTTLLNCLSQYIPHKERIVTIEDTAEVQLLQPHVVTLEARPQNMEGSGEVTIEELVKNALRMRPDRVVVGECRGKEALDMLQAMNTGHDGSMTTAHANSPQELILRLETMVLMGVDMPISAIRSQIVAAVDVIVQLQRTPDGRRCITHISEVVGIDQQTNEVIVEDIFKYIERQSNATSTELNSDDFAHTGHMPHFIDTLLRNTNSSLGSFF